MKRGSKYIGLEVKVEGMGTGKIVGPSQQFNGTWVIFINGKNKEIHDQYVKTLDGNYLGTLP